MDGGTFATGLAVGLFLGVIGGAFVMCLFTADGESRRCRNRWPDESEPEPERVLRVVPDTGRPVKRGRQRSYS